MFKLKYDKTFDNNIFTKYHLKPILLIKEIKTQNSIYLKVAITATIHIFVRKA